METAKNIQSLIREFTKNFDGTNGFNGFQFGILNLRDQTCYLGHVDSPTMVVVEQPSKALLLHNVNDESIINLKDIDSQESTTFNETLTEQLNKLCSEMEDYYKETIANISHGLWDYIQ